MVLSTFWIWVVSYFSMINYMRTKETPSDNDMVLIEKYTSEYKRLLELQIANNKNLPLKSKKHHEQAKKLKDLGLLFVSLAVSSCMRLHI